MTLIHSMVSSPSCVTVGLLTSGNHSFLFKACGSSFSPFFFFLTLQPIWLRLIFLTVYLQFEKSSPTHSSAPHMCEYNLLRPSKRWRLTLRCSFPFLRSRRASMSTLCLSAGGRHQCPAAERGTMKQIALMWSIERCNCVQTEGRVSEREGRRVRERVQEREGERGWVSSHLYDLFLYFCYIVLRTSCLFIFY